MSTDLIDVERRLGQFGPEVVLVGPLLSFAINSRYRYFYIAGNGSEVYENISLGFMEVESEAQTQRADFIETLANRFAEVLTFGDQLEMTHAVYTRWPNAETAKFLAFAELKGKSESAKVVGRLGSIDDDGSYAGVPPPPWTRDEGQPVLHPTLTLAPPSRARSLASNILRLCAFGCAAALVATIITWAIVRPTTRQIAAEAVPAPIPAPLISVERNEALSQSALAEPPSVPNQLAEVSKPEVQAEPAPAEVPTFPPSQPSHVPSVQAGAAPVSGPQSMPAQSGNTTRHIDAEEIATLVNRGTNLLKSGDLLSARLLLRRAAEAGSASAALMLGTTFDSLVIQQLDVIGVVPDVAQARQWYEKAAELGSDAASQRLAKLPQTGQ